MSIIKKSAYTAAAIALLIGGSLYLLQDRTAPSQAGTGRHQKAELALLPKFPDLQGKEQALAQWQGKIMIVNFWASWCPPCLAEIPGFINLQQQYGKQGVQFIGIALDQENRVQTYAKKMGINYPVLLGGTAGADLARQLGNTQGGLPYSVIIDHSGNIVSTHLGLLRHDKLERILKPLLSPLRNPD